MVFGMPFSPERLSRNVGGGDGNQVKRELWRNVMPTTLFQAAPNGVAVELFLIRCTLGHAGAVCFDDHSH